MFVAVSAVEGEFRAVEQADEDIFVGLCVCGLLADEFEESGHLFGFGSAAEGANEEFFDDFRRGLAVREETGDDFATTDASGNGLADEKVERLGEGGLGLRFAGAGRSSEVFSGGEVRTWAFS